MADLEQTPGRPRTDEFLISEGFLRPKVYEVKSVQDFAKLTSGFHEPVLFRGQAQEWALLPTVGRPCENTRAIARRTYDFVLIIASTRIESRGKHPRHITNPSGPPRLRRPCSFCHRFISEFHAIASLPRSVGKNFISEVDEKCAAIRQAFFGDTAVGKTQRTATAIRIAGSLGFQSFP